MSPSSLARWGGLAVMLGGALFVVSAQLIASMPQGCPLMLFFAIPGVLALVVGFVLVGLAVLRVKVLPRWAAVLLVVGSLAMLGFNDQNAQALMAIPNGMAWMAAGCLLWSGKEKPVRQPARKL